MPFVITDRVSVDPHRYPGQQQKVTELMELINIDVLLNPIVFDWKLNLLLELHYFVAYKKLGFKQIECNTITSQANRIAQLAEIDKILFQNEPNTIQQTDWQSEQILKQIKLKTLSESNYSKGGGEIVTQPAKAMKSIEDVGNTQQTSQHSQQMMRNLLPQAKAGLGSSKILKSTKAFVDEIDVQTGDRWFLEPHLIYCGDTSSNAFIDSLPSNTALAIASPSPTWNHDYLINEARVVAVLRSEGYVHELCRHHQMAFKFELLISDIYVGIFSQQSIPKPQRPIEIEGLEGIVSYLINLYTDRGNSVILPFLGVGEVLVACERMGRICFAGDENSRSVSRAIARWQNLTGKQPYKLFYRS